MVEKAEQRSGRDFNALRPGGHNSARAGNSAHSDRFAHLWQVLDAVRSDRRMDRRHEEGGGDSFAADVADGKDQFVRAGGEKIVVVAADGAGGATESVDFQGFEAGSLTRK